MHTTKHSNQDGLNHLTVDEIFDLADQGIIELEFSPLPENIQKQIDSLWTDEEWNELTKPQEQFKTQWGLLLSALGLVALVIYGVIKLIHGGIFP